MVVGMVRGVLHETVHDVVSLRTQGLVINTWDCEVHERSLTHSMGLSLVVGVD